MEEKRRLPSWMVSASTANKPVVEPRVVTKSTKPKAKGVTRNHEKEAGLSGDKNVLVKCETKRKKKRLVEDDFDQEVEVEKRKSGRVKRKVDGSETLRKKNEESYELVENQALYCDEEEEDDLTMDDVLSIAKEFVENDKKDTGQQKPEEVQPVLKNKSAYVGSSGHEPVETTNVVTLSDFNMTGDPAQDMLDLFLGPLLKKPVAKEETSSTHDIIIPREIKNQQHSSVISDKPVTLTKKKSSLRDAVAMLLN